MVLAAFQISSESSSLIHIKQSAEPRHGGLAQPRQFTVSGDGRRSVPVEHADQEPQRTLAVRVELSHQLVGGPPAHGAEDPLV